MPDRYAAFISYAHHYKEWVATLQRNLESCLKTAGADASEIFLDQTDLASGRSWATQLQEGLERSDQLILVATPEALASPRVGDEWESFLSARRDWAQGRFHVVLLVDVPLPFFADRIQRLNFVEHDAEQYRDELQKLVGGLLGRGARDLPELPADLEIRPPPADVLPTDLRQRLVGWLALQVRRKVLRGTVSNALGVAPAILEGHTTPEAAAFTALVAAPGDDDRIQAARRIVRSLRDAFDEEDADLLAELDALAEELERLGSGSEGGLLRTWLARVARDHSNLVPFFEHADLELLDRVYVQLEVRPEERLTRDKKEMALGLERQALTLRDLLALERGEPSWVTHRWVVRGDPGAGKTTLLRHLAATLAVDKQRRWVPVFEPLPRLMRQPEWLLDRLEREMRKAGEPAQGLAAALGQEGQEGRLLLLLDGLDEVPRDDREDAEALLRQISTRWPETPVVVTSRPIGYRRPGSEFVELDLLAFDEKQRREFLARWFGRSSAKADRRRAAEVMEVLQGDGGLWDLSGNPLYLTLMALLFEQDKKPERNRATLYDQVFDLLLDRRHSPVGQPIDAKKAVYGVLRRLACDMTQDNRDAEAKSEIEARLLKEAYDPLCAPLHRVPPWERSLGPFLDDLSEKTGILGPHDGPSADWRYWHRTFREALTAEQLAADLDAGGEAAILARAREVAGDESRWAEPFALLVGRVEDPDALVTSLVETNRALGLRAVATAQRLGDETLRAVLNLTDEWEERSKVYREIPELIDDPERALALVDQLRQRMRDGNDLYFLEETASAIGERWPEVEGLVEQLRGYFFDHVPAPPEDLFGQVETRDGQVDLRPEDPAGEGWVGAADGEEEEHDEERPRHRVKIVQPFSMAAVPVTNTQYAAFDPGHRWWEWKGVSREELARHPVVNVTWYAAVAFCRWLSASFPGARLPLEEEWEYACRAGTETRYWSGEGEKDLERVGWYGENSGNRTHRVGQKPANPWQLYDMHGNVLEWTLTAFADNDGFNNAYKGCEGGLRIDPAAPAAVASRGGGRVIRGGSFWLTAVRARAASRNGVDPDFVNRDLGFRVVLPRPRAGL